MDYKEQQVVLSYLEHERLAWLPARERARRAGNMNADLNRVEDASMVRIDRLLDELNALALAGVEVADVPSDL